MSKPDSEDGPERKRFRGRSIEPHTERQLDQDCLNVFRGSLPKREGLRPFQLWCFETLYAWGTLKKKKTKGAPWWQPSKRVPRLSCRFRGCFPASLLPGFIYCPGTEEYQRAAGGAEPDARLRP